MSTLSRRKFILGAGATATALLVGACQSVPSASQIEDLIAATERRRRREGAPLRTVELAAVAGTVELGRLKADSWSYGGVVPGPEIRVAAGEVLAVRFANYLPVETTIHWHGIALRNDMDGVPGVTQNPIPPDGDFTYEFTLPDPGTYFYHPHVGVQLDRGLYGALIVEDPREPGAYDREVVLVLDDWTDGIAETPDQIFARLAEGGMGGMGGMAGMEGMGGMGGMAGMEGMDQSGMGTEGQMPAMASSDVLGGDAGDVLYPEYLINGRPADDPAVIEAQSGERIRIRLINAAADTAFRMAVGGHRLTVTHTDGFPVIPEEGDALLIGMGERYDLSVTVGDGVIPVVAAAEGKGAVARALIRTGTGAPPPVDYLPAELQGRLLTVADLTAEQTAFLAPAEPDRVHRMELGGNMMSYRWTINGETFDGTLPLDVRSGERVRLEFDNKSMMFHPMHLHGHTFQMTGSGGGSARKDTVIVRPGERLLADYAADNPGRWVAHCHNIYHAEAGMMTGIAYSA